MSFKKTLQLKISYVSMASFLMASALTYANELSQELGVSLEKELTQESYKNWEVSPGTEFEKKINLSEFLSKCNNQAAGGDYKKSSHAQCKPNSSSKTSVENCHLVWLYEETSGEGEFSCTLEFQRDQKTKKPIKKTLRYSFSG